MTRRWRALHAARLERPAALLGCLCMCWSLLAGCRDSSSATLATLQLTLGVVERDSSAQPKVWKAAEIGSAFGFGEAVQTRAASTALLQLTDGDQLSMEPETLIRFSPSRPEPHTLDMDLELGSISVSAGTAELSIQTRAGLAKIAPGSRVLLAHSSEGVRFSVQVGRAVFAGDTPLTAGNALLIDPEGARRALPGMPDSAPGAALSLPIVARVSGTSARIRTASGWSPLDEGAAQLSAGAELELQGDTSVQLERAGARAVLQAQGHYVIAPREDILVSAASGSLSAGSSAPVRIEVPGGVIEVVAEGRANIHLLERATELEVQARSASLETTRGTQQFSAGARVTVLADGTTQAEGRGLDYADTELRAGESVVIHDPAPPTAVRFAFGELCPEQGVLQLFAAGHARDVAAGSGSTSLALEPGKYRYELRCANGASAAAAGTVQVLKDSASRRLSSHPPETTLQADGREYTVLYQNHLPEITLVWRDAPAGKALRLVHEFEQKTTALPLTEARYAFASGSLEEGTHVLHFEGTDAVSRRTTVHVAFDNATPKASIATASSLPTRAGEPVTIAGTALSGWSVAVEEQAAKPDAQGRFSSSALWPSERRALTIRLSHPLRGVHLYLRRSQS